MSDEGGNGNVFDIFSGQQVKAAEGHPDIQKFIDEEVLHLGSLVTRLADAESATEFEWLKQQIKESVAKW